jgi:hypothetical protein
LLAEEWKEIEETNRHAGDDKGTEKFLHELGTKKLSTRASQV